MLFAKNSDRERNEAQALEFKTAEEHEHGASLLCTYITIPQARRTHACLISRPCWMWGTEMGANEHGLVIGNEAMHAVIPPQETPALTGMDLLRLALERAASAAEAVDVITSLLEAYGQGGNCGHLHEFYYHNGFLIADGREAFVLETVGRWWTCERVHGERALSNAYSIERGYDHVSADLQRHAKQNNWLDAEGRFDFAARFLNEERDAVSFGRGRCARGAQLLAARNGALTAQHMMGILRDHGVEGEALAWTPEHTKHRSICMHAAAGARRSQTTASWVTEWTANGAVHWVTGTSAPCLSVFKPVALGAIFSSHDDDPPTDKFSPRTRWWTHELWHRAALCNYAEAAASIMDERDRLESKFSEAMRQAPSETLAYVIATCWREAKEAEARWATRATHDGYAQCGEAYLQSWAKHDEIGMVPRRAR
jgi:dipeptidase